MGGFLIFLPSRMGVFWDLTRAARRQTLARYKGIKKDPATIGGALRYHRRRRFGFAFFVALRTTRTGNAKIIKIMFHRPFGHICIYRHRFRVSNIQRQQPQRERRKLLKLLCIQALFAVSSLIKISISNFLNLITLFFTSISLYHIQLSTIFLSLML